MAKSSGAKKPPADDSIEREMQARAKESEGRADLVHEQAHSARLANEERKARTGRGVPSETEAKIGVHQAQAAVHHARARVFDAQAEAVTAKRKNDREAHLTHRDQMKRAANNADTKSQADVAHTHARAALTQAQAQKAQAETAAVRYRTSSAARSEPFQRESEERARTVWAQQDEDRDRRNAHFEARARRENVHHTVTAVRGVLGAFGGGNGELRSGLRGQLRNE